MNFLFWASLYCIWGLFEIILVEMLFTFFKILNSFLSAFFVKLFFSFLLFPSKSFVLDNRKPWLSIDSGFKLILLPEFDKFSNEFLNGFRFPLSIWFFCFFLFGGKLLFSFFFILLILFCNFDCSLLLFSFFL